MSSILKCAGNDYWWEFTPTNLKTLLPEGSATGLTSIRPESSKQLSRISQYAAVFCNIQVSFAATCGTEYQGRTTNIKTYNKVLHSFIYIPELKTFKERQLRKDETFYGTNLLCRCILLTCTSIND